MSSSTWPPPSNQAGIVIIDNLPAHKVEVITTIIEAVGAALVYLPPYSPDVNPIEQVFAKLKALLRKAAARTIPALCDSIGLLLTAFGAKECASYFPHAGYAST